MDALSSARSDILRPYADRLGEKGSKRRRAKAGLLVLQVPTALIGILIIALALALAVVGVLLVHRLVPIEVRKSYSTGLGQIRGSLAAMFAIIVGFAAFLTLSNYHGAQLTVQSEAENVHEIYILAQALPQPKREQIQGLAISYARVVIEEEWPLRREGRTSQRAHDIADELRRSIQDGYTASSDAQQGIYGELLSVMNQLDEDRDTRLIVRTDLPLILWVALVVLGTIIVGFAAMADMENRPIHLLAVCALATSIAVVFFTIFVLDYPFRTDINPVGPQPFESVLHEMEGNDT